MRTIPIENQQDFVSDGLTSAAKWRSQMLKVSLSIQPDSLLVTSLPIGAPSVSSGTILFLLKRIIGGTKCPAALQQQMTVVLVPLSPLETDPI